MGYIAFVLDDKSRTKLLRMWPTSHPDVICHHVTLEFGVPETRLVQMMEELGPVRINVRGIAKNDSVEALLVTVNDRAVRPDGKIYHITHSIDRLKGAKPVHSNELVSDASTWEINKGFCYVFGSIKYFN